MAPERVIRFPARTVLSVLAIVLAVLAVLQLLLHARQVLTWVLIAVFFALALNPLVELIQRRLIKRRALATALAFVIALAVIAALGGTFIPVLVDEVNEFARAVPGYVEDLTKGRGRLGFLETRYGIVERVETAIDEGGVSRVLGLSGTAVAITKGVVTIVIATITIVFLTFFMLLEGPAWLERAYSLLPEESQERWRRVGHDIYRTVGGYVSGALLIALIAGVSATILLSVLSVPYAIALGLVVALLDLIPLAGATLATVVVSTVALLDSPPVGIAVLIYFIVYQQIENHVLYPAIYSRTVALSPLVILISVLIGASLAGILGALAAIPMAGVLQVLFLDWLRHRRGGGRAELDEPPEPPLPPPAPEAA